MYDLFEPYLDRLECRREAVSQWSVGMHLDHCVLSALRITEMLATSDPAAGRPEFSLLRRIVLFTGIIPRGRGRAPAPSLPAPEISRDQAEQGLLAADRALERMAGLGPETWWRHEVFGAMGPADTRRFIDVHNHHHLKIIRDIVKG